MYCVLDHTDRRLLGKLRACERRRVPFTPGLRLIAHDLSLPVVTVWRRLHKLAARGLVEIWRAPRGMRYLWRTAVFWRQRALRWYTPPETGEYSASCTTFDIRETRCNGAGIRLYRTKDPPAVASLAELFANSGLRAAIPWPVRGFCLRKLSRGLVRAGMNHADGEYVAKRSHNRPKLLGWFLAKPERWKDLLLDRGLGKRHRRKETSFLASSASLRVDKPAPDPVSDGNSLDALLGAVQVQG